MRRLILGLFIFAAMVTAAYASPMTGTVKALGGATTSVAHCQVLYYSIPASDTITTVNANVECDTTASFTVNASIHSGATTGTGSNAASFTAGTPQVVTISISPSVPITSQTYDATFTVKN